MTDFTYGQLRPNWVSAVGFEAVTSNMEFITISTAIDIRTYAQNVLAGGSITAATASQGNLNKLLEIVSLRGQPVIMGNVIPTFTNTYFTILLATEHAGGWQNVSSPNTLIQRIILDGVNFGFGANLSSVTSATTTATVGATVINVASTAGVLDGDTFTGTGVVGGVVFEVLGTTSFLATAPQTISSGVTLTFVPATGTAVDDTTTSGLHTGLQVSFTGIMT